MLPLPSQAVHMKHMAEGTFYGETSFKREFFIIFSFYMLLPIGSLAELLIPLLAHSSSSNMFFEQQNC
jgi:hypothetical protein